MTRAARLGLLGGLIAVFVAAIGVVEDFSERGFLSGMSLGTAILLAVPLGFGFLAGSAPGPAGGRAPLWAGMVAGLVTGAVMALFVVLIAHVDVQDVFINITPALAAADDGPQLLTFGRSLGSGIALILALDTALGGVGGALRHLPGTWRRAVVTGAAVVVGLAVLQPFVQQVLRGLQDEVRLWTSPVDRFLYGGGSLRVLAALLAGVGGAGLALMLRRPDHVPLTAWLDRLPEGSRRWMRRAAVLATVPLVALLPQVLGPFLSEVVGMAGIFVLMGLGLNIVVGYAGLLDLGYVAFFAVGAYTTAVLTSPTGGFELGWIVLAAIPFVLLASAVAGVVVGAPVLRMRGDYLAVATLGFGEIARLLLLSDWLAPTFGGAQGIVGVPDLRLGPLEVRNPQTFLYVLSVLIVLAAYISSALQDSRMGRAWMALREDETAAEAMGVDVVAAKLSAFVVGALFAGLGGALFATRVGSVFPQSFDVIVSVTVLVVVIVGGMASVRGVILGAFVLVGLPQLLRELEDHRHLLYGALLVAMMLRHPEGLLPSRRRARELGPSDLAQDAWLPPADGAEASVMASDRG